LRIDAGEKPAQIVGDEISNRRLVLRNRSVVRVSVICPAWPRCDERRRHPTRLRNCKVLGDVLEHGRASRIDVVSLEKGPVGGFSRLGPQTCRDDIERVFKKAYWICVARKA
jgi:hypothetical protein